MKSRTSFFNGAIFRKNLTRFAPLWILYTLCLLLGMLLLAQDNLEFWFAAHLGTMSSGMGAIGCGYALLVAQILFGDLWNPRMCNALHAMPLRRECWFSTHVISGMFFNLIPTGIMAAVAEVLIVTSSKMVDGWQIPLYFLLAANLEYLFFFGLASLSALMTGNRVGMAVIYGIINFFSYLAYFLAGTLIQPLYYGVVLSEKIFLLLCPVAQISNSGLIISLRHKLFAETAAAGSENYQVYGTFHLTEDWTYLWIVAAIGIGLLLLARYLYRRRRLECAGDFLATKKLEPVFMVVFSITVGTVFQFMESVFMGVNYEVPVFLFAGLVVGWFAGRMLLERQTAVFHSLKNWLGLVVLAVVLGGALYGAGLDPFGVEDWVPQVEDVRSVQINSGGRGIVKVEDPAEIADIIAIHRGILEDKLTGEEADREWMRAHEEAMKLPEVQSGRKSSFDLAERIGYRKYVNLYITYDLAGGWQVSRNYYLWVDTDHGQLAKKYLSRVAGIFYEYQEIPDGEALLDLVRAPAEVYFVDRKLPEEFLTAEFAEGLLRAVIADCEAGTMVQNRQYHDGFIVDTEAYTLQSYSMDMMLGEESLHFYIYNDSENCLAWLEESGVLDYFYRQRTEKPLG